MAQLSDMSTRETREELILDSLEKVHCLTDLLDYDSGLSKRGQDCLRKIRNRSHALMETLIEPETPSATIIPLKPM